MDWLRHRDALVGAAVMGAGIALGILLIVALVMGFADIVHMAGDL